MFYIINKYFLSTYNMKKAFTLVELIVVITILAVLATVAFISFQWYTQSAKNSVVSSDIKNMKKAFDLHLLQWNSLPEPDGPTLDITKAGAPVSTQWYLWQSVVVAVQSITSAPINPTTQELFSYSKTRFSNEYQIMSDIFETALNNGPLNAHVYAADQTAKRIEWNYNWLIAYTSTWGVNYIVALPSLMTTSTWSDINLNDTNKNLYENNKSQLIDYSPKTLWAGKQMPSNVQEVSQFMESIALAYQESSIQTSQRVQNISAGQDTQWFHKTTNAILKKIPWIDENLTKNITRQCDVDGWDVRQDFKNGAWWDCYRVACYAWFTPVWDFGCQWNNAGFTLDADNFTQSDEPIFKVAEIDGEKMFYQEGQRNFYTSGLIPVDTSKTYSLSGRFKKLWWDNNIMYFWLKSFDENKQEITAWKVLRTWNEITIQSFDDEKITWIETPVGWAVWNVDFYKKSIWIYYDWDTTKLPDHVLKWEDFYYSDIWRTPAYTEIVGRDIMLNRKIPDEIAANIVPWITKIRNHTSWATFIYFYASAASPSPSLPENWETRSWSVTWEVFSTSNSAFRTWTKYVQVHILANHIADAGVDYKMWFDDIVFQELP